jgi:hypothetical protein
MENENIDDILIFLQNKTIKSVDIELYDGNHRLVFILSCGTRAYISANGSMYIALERHLIN